MTNSVPTHFILFRSCCKASFLLIVSCKPASCLATGTIFCRIGFLLSMIFMLGTWWHWGREEGKQRKGWPSLESPEAWHPKLGKMLLGELAGLGRLDGTGSEVKSGSSSYKPWDWVASPTSCLQSHVSNGHGNSAYLIGLVQGLSEKGV